VFDNVAFGLKMRKVRSSELKERVAQVLDLVQLTQMQQRYPRQLSGGQQQRVALARAIVIEPYVLLLDEPLSNLDAKLRKAMQTELRDLQRRLGITAIYVTHDQEEAMTVSDRIVVMNQGQIMQIGTPTEVYRKPANEFVAGFIGQVNFIRGRLERAEGGWTFIGDPGLIIPVPDHAVHAAARRGGVPVELSVRPEAIEIAPCADGVATAVSLSGVVTRAVYTGASTTYQVRLDGGQTLQVVEQDRPGSRHWSEGDAVTVVLAPETLYVVPLVE
jgi:ABC-type Fe3+/spermidine/putrescine transport system ATPase subunit